MIRLWMPVSVCVLALLSHAVVFGEQAPAPPPPPAPAVAEPPAPPVVLAESKPIFGVEVDPEIVRLPATVFADGQAGQPALRLAGLPGLSAKTSDLRAESAKMTGLRVRQVFPGTMAEQAGLQPGDVIYKINNHRIRNFDDVMEILVELRPNVKGRVDYVRVNATFIRDFTVDETYNNDFNLLYLIWARGSRFAGRFDFCLLVCNIKELKTKGCGSFAFLGPLIFDYHKVGPAESVTTLLFLTFRKGQAAPVVF